MPIRTSKRACKLNVSSEGLRAPQWQIVLQRHQANGLSLNDASFIPDSFLFIVFLKETNQVFSSHMHSEQTADEASATNSLRKRKWSEC